MFEHSADMMGVAPGSVSHCVYLHTSGVCSFSTPCLFAAVRFLSCLWCYSGKPYYADLYMYVIYMYT